MFVRPVQLFQAVGQWYVQSHEVARRNALMASATLAQRRRERDEVERYLKAQAMTRTRIPAHLSADPASLESGVSRSG